MDLYTWKDGICIETNYRSSSNKANLRDLIAATGPVNLIGLCDLEMGWTCKMVVQVFYASQNFKYNFIAICELKLGLQFGNTQFRSKSSILGPVWPWNLTEVQKWYYDTALWRTVLNVSGVLIQATYDTDTNIPHCSVSTEIYYVHVTFQYDYPLIWPEPARIWIWELNGPYRVGNTCGLSQAYSHLCGNGRDVGNHTT